MDSQGLSSENGTQGGGHSKKRKHDDLYEIAKALRRKEMKKKSYERRKKKNGKIMKQRNALSNRKHHTKNKNKHAKRCKKYYEQHQEKINQRHRDYHEQHKEEDNQRHRDYHEQHQEKINQRHRDYHEQHKEEDNQRRRDYHEKHQEEDLGRRAHFGILAGSTPGIDSFNFKKFEDCPEASAMLLHYNNGTHQWRAMGDLTSPSTTQEEKEAAIQKLKERIKGQFVSPTRQKELGEEFLAAQGRGCLWGLKDEFVPGKSIDAPIYACACCGFRAPDVLDIGTVSYSYKPVEDLKEVLLLRDNDLHDHLYRMSDDTYTMTLPIDEEGNTDVFPVWKAWSIWGHPENKEEYYHLHPEFVEEYQDKDKGGKVSYRAMVCDTCWKYIMKGKKPPLSIASGVDFGHFRRIHPNLEPLSLFERHIVSKVRSYAQVIKIESNTNRRREHTQCTLKGCCIVFPHDSPTICRELLTEKSMKQNLCLHFVGAEVSTIARNMNFFVQF